LVPGVIWGLYVHLRDTPDAMRPFLVDITPYRVVFSATLVPRGPCDISEMYVRAWSLVMRLLTQTGLLASHVTCDSCKRDNTVSKTKIEPSCVGIGQKLTSVDWKTPTTMVVTFSTSWLRIWRNLIRTDTWLCCTNFLIVCSKLQSNGPSLRTIRQTHLIRPSVGIFSQVVWFWVISDVKIWFIIHTSVHVT